MTRPPVTVVMPFFGDEEDLAEAMRSLDRLRLNEADQVIIADNAAVARGSATGRVEILSAGLERSSYHARNAGAESARNEWLVFIDSDCRPAPDLLDGYFGEPVPGDVALLVGGVVSAPEQEELIARYARVREHISERWHVERTVPHPSGPTANLAVRKAAWDSMGGFFEGVVSGEDIEFCFRAQDAGWKLLHRPAAQVEHVHPNGLRPMLRKARRHAAGRTWVTRRYPSAYEPFRAGRSLARAVAGTLAWAFALRLERSLFKALDGVRTVAEADGLIRGDNRAVRTCRQAAGDDIVVFVDGYPARSETFVYHEVETMRELGQSVSVMASARPARIEREVARREDVYYFEDEPVTAKLTSLLRLASRHPLRCSRDLVDRRRWRREEDAWPLAALAPAALRLARSRPHLHAHFAAGACLNAMRVARILGLRYSVTAHAFDIFQKPRNLREKLERSAFATSESDYAVSHLRGLVAQSHRDRIVPIATGVRAEFFERDSEFPPDGYVLAIGRLIEKKGFENLIDAIARIEQRERPRVVIAGDGPLKSSLAERVERAGLESWIRLEGNVWGPAAVRSMLEGASCLCVPSVIAADGDRDDMPVVIYEALAMGVPIVASELVGIPEVVRAGWGRLAEPGDPDSLASAIRDLTRLPSAERQKMGERGRAFVMAEKDQRTETARLLKLIQRLPSP